MDRFEVRLSITKLLIVLVVVIVPLSIVGLVLTSRSDHSLDNAIGTDYKALAQTYGNDVSDFIRDRVADVTAMASDSAVLGAVAGHNAPTKTAAATPAPKASLNTSASEFLRQRRILDPRYMNIVLTDMNGNVVGSATQPPKTDYSQDDFWQSVYNKGQGTVRISDIIDNELAKAQYVNIGFPISDASGNFIGVVSAAVNISPLLSRFQQNEIGNGAHAALVDENGQIISAPNTDVFSRAKSAEFDSVRDALANTQGQQSGWTLANVRNGPFIVGYASTGMKQHFDNLGWFVLVSQREALAAAPIRELERFALIMVILAVFMLTLLFVYWYLHHKQRFQDIEEASEEDTGRAAAASV